jgi:aminoglycoside phosphotransferase (APT) family kinase protein
VVRLEDALAEALPAVRARRLEIVDEGWDSIVAIVNREWVLRVAGSDGVRFADEARIMRELAPALPLPTPVIERHTEAWALTRYLPGRRSRGWFGGAQLGRFLRALHAFPLQRARELGVREYDRDRKVASFAESVLPVFERRERASAEALLDEFARSIHPLVVAHTDVLAPHVLVRRGRITGILDWPDVRLADPALDLAWPLFGAHRRFAAAVSDAYAVDRDTRRRAEVWWRLEPWHEVIQADEPRIHAAAVAHVRERLPKVTGGADTMAR